MGKKGALVIKKFRVSGMWHREYLADDATHANELAHADINMINVHNMTHVVQEIKEQELHLKAVEEE